VSLDQVQGTNGL